MGRPEMEESKQQATPDKETRRPSSGVVDHIKQKLVTLIVASLGLGVDSDAHGDGRCGPELISYTRAKLGLDRRVTSGPYQGNLPVTKFSFRAIPDDFWSVPLDRMMSTEPQQAAGASTR